MDEALFRAFYLERIPSQFERARAEAGDRATSVDASLAIVLRDPQAPQQELVLEIAAGHMRAVETSSAPRLLTLVHDAGAFAVIERESGDSILGFVAGMAGVTGELALTRTRVARLREIDGSIGFERTGERPFSLVVHFGDGAPGDRPDCRLRMTAETHERLRSGALDPQDAFLTEEVQVEGDMQKALQLAYAVLEPA